MYDAPDLVVYCVEPDDTVHRFQGPVLPGLDVGYDMVGDLGKYIVWDIRVVDLLDVRRYIAIAHPKAIEAYDLIGQVILNGWFVASWRYQARSYCDDLRGSRPKMCQRQF